MNFEDFLQQKGIIPKTISRHQREVAKYETWLENTYNKIPECASQKDLLEYLKHIKEYRKINNASQNGVLLILKNYYAHLAKEHGIKNITSLIKIRGIKRKHIPLIFTPEEMELLCDAYFYHIQEYEPKPIELFYHPNHKKYLQGRYLALTLIAYQGLKSLEIENLRQADFDLRKGTVNIGKTFKNAVRKLPLEPVQIGYLLQYFADGEDTPLIPNRNDFQSLSKTLKKIQPNFSDFLQVR